MELQRYTDVSAFYRRAEPFLLAHEAEHCLPIGICATLIASPETRPQNLYLALVGEGADVVAAAVRTPPNNLVLSLIADEARMPQALALLACNIHSAYGDMLPGIVAPSTVSQRFAVAWQRETGQAHHVVMRQRIYQLDTVIPVSDVPGAPRRATEADRALLEAWIAAFHEAAASESRLPLNAREWVDQLFTPAPVRAVYLWEVDSTPVTMVGHTGPTPHGMRIGPVYTPPEQRRHGYASACTAAVSQRLLDSGRRFCFLFTDLANLTANAIYQQIGYRPVCDVDVYEFANQRGEESPV